MVSSNWDQIFQTSQLVRGKVKRSHSDQIYGNITKIVDQLNIDLLNYTLKIRQMTTAIWRWYNRGLQATLVLMDPSKEVEEGAAFVSPEKDRWEIWPVMIPENVKSLRRVIVFNSSGLGLCVKNYSQFTLRPFHGFFVLARSASEHCGREPFLVFV